MECEMCIARGKRPEDVGEASDKLVGMSSVKVCRKCWEREQWVLNMQRL